MRFANADGFCELNPFPGCKWLAVSNYAYIYPNKRGKGKGRANHQLRRMRAKEMGYSALICTVNNSNEPEKHILETEGWAPIGQFTTHDNTIIKLFMIQL